MTKHELTPEVISQIVDFAKKYVQKGDLVGIPREVISVMLQRQYEQQGKWDVGIFEKSRVSGLYWEDTVEKYDFFKVTLGLNHEPDFKTFFTRYPERFESEPQFRDSLGYPLEIGEEMFFDDHSAHDAIIDDYTDDFKGITAGEYKGSLTKWKFAVSVKAYQNNPSEVMERIKQLEQKNKPEQVKQEEKPTKPVYVTPCGTFTEGEEVITGLIKRLFYKYDERLQRPYILIDFDDEAKYSCGDKFHINVYPSINKLTTLPTIEEVANKAGITVEQLREVVKQGK